jgi:uncharacterized protein
MSASATKPGPYPTATSAPFWRAAQEQRLVVQHCGDCGTWQHYPRAICAECWGGRLRMAEASGKGTVWTFTVVHRPGHPAWAAEVPYALAIVELEEGPRLIANIVGCHPRDVRVGMPVSVVFEQRDGYAAVQFTPAAEPAPGR